MPKPSVTLGRRGHVPRGGEIPAVGGDTNFHWGFTVTQDGLTESTGTAGTEHIDALHSANARNAFASVPHCLFQFAKDHFGVYPVQYVSGTWDWTGSIRGAPAAGHMPDDTISLIDGFRHATSKLMMQAYGIPGWQAGLGLGNDFTPVAPDTLAHEDALAADCALFADRFDGTGGFPLLQYLPVWNEMKGMDAGGFNSTERAKYIRIYNKIWTAVKAVRPDMLIGGPYVKWYSYGATTTGNPSSDNGLASCSGTGFVIHNHVLDLHYEFERDCDYDFIATDVWTGNDNHSTTYNIHTGVTQHQQMLSKFDVVTARIRAMHPGGKPIIFTEFYPQGENPNYNGSDNWTNADIEDWVIELLDLLNPYGPGWLCAWGEAAEPPNPITWVTTGAATRLISLLIAREASL